MSLRNCDIKQPQKSFLNHNKKSLITGGLSPQIKGKEKRGEMQGKKDVSLKKWSMS